MQWEAWTTLAAIGAMTIALVRNWAGPDTVMIGGLTFFMAMRPISIWFGVPEADCPFPSPADALAGLGTEAPWTIAVLYVVAEGLRQTGAMTLVSQGLLGRPRSVAGAQSRLMLPVAGLSAFLNNTPIVAMFMPVVTDWCKKTRISPSKLFIPLSYAAILGGTCTVIGTATNIVVKDMVDQSVAGGALQGVHIGMFTNAWVGVPAACVGIGFVLLTSRWLLPDRGEGRAAETEAREYTVEMRVEPGSPIVGKTIEQAGLRHLPGVYLMAIERDGREIAAVSPREILNENDQLVFVGMVDSVVDLQKTRGLVPATEQVFKLDAPRQNRRLFEAVVSERCPMIGKTIRESKFRSTYNAVVIAVHRGGERLRLKIGDIVLKPGDTLLIEGAGDFANIHRNRSDFYLVSTIADSQPVRHDKAWIALVLLVAMVGVVTLTHMKLVVAALIASGVMMLTRCCTAGEARASINWRVLLTIGAALGIGATLDRTGAAEYLATQIVDVFAGFGPIAVLAAIYLFSMCLTSLIGPIGTVALMFPIAMNIADAENYNFMPFAITLMMTAATSFATPTGYQTNLMVYGAGGYKFSDFVRIGLPLNLCVMATTLIITPMIWPIVQK